MNTEGKREKEDGKGGKRMKKRIAIEHMQILVFFSHFPSHFPFSPRIVPFLYERQPCQPRPNYQSPGRPVRIHPTAVLEEGVTVGEGTAIWDHVHVRHHARIGEECIIGGKTMIAYDVRIGNRVKINSFVYVCTGVTIEDGVMVSAGTVFTNDRFPRATTPDLKQLRASDPDEHTLPTLVREGATIGAQCTIGNDLAIGRFAMVGMGSVVTKSVPDFHLVLGNPARSVGCVCRCGQLMLRFTEPSSTVVQPIACNQCGFRYSIHGGEVSEVR